MIEFCRTDEFHCGMGYCIDAAGMCDGFVDCHVNTDDEDVCGMSKLGYIETYIKKKKT